MAKTVKAAKAKSVADLLSGILGETFQLYTNTLACHWNVVGANFVSLHQLFGEQYEELAEAIDELAERLRAIDAPAPAGLAALKDLATGKDGAGAGKAEKMVASLLSAHEHLIERLSDAIITSGDLGDYATEDMLIGRLAAHQKQAWMLKSLLV